MFKLTKISLPEFKRFALKIDWFLHGKPYEMYPQVYHKLKSTEVINFELFDSLGNDVLGNPQMYMYY